MNHHQSGASAQSCPRTSRRRMQSGLIKIATICDSPSLNYLSFVQMGKCSFVRANIKLLDSHLAVCCVRESSHSLNLKAAYRSRSTIPPLSTCQIPDAFISNLYLASPLNLPKCSLGNGRDLRSVSLNASVCGSFTRKQDMLSTGKGLVA
ncbi:hypothetical protein BC830DRAFT_1104085 [Chytriomyces sp. MP71]|nr:hypothetical protein BC830DRAFT_1104085 [Chytriomyces sp. MP71]